MKLCVLLTQYKRSHLKEQLEQIKNQSLEPDFLIVFQNENHVDEENIKNLKQKYNFIHVKSDYNTKYFGRFSYCFNIPADIFIILDDDMIPGKKCFEKYVNECIETNAIIGGNGRYCKNYSNIQKLKTFSDFGIRNKVRVDFVGHLWCFKKEWLYYMFRDEPYTYDSGEDMHFCFSAKLYGNIDSYICPHTTLQECSDIKFNKYAIDKYSSFKRNGVKELRDKILQHWFKKGYKLIESN